LLQGSATGSAVYVETHRKTTNANGLVSLEIGTGTVLSGSFASINWANGPYLIKTETDPTGGTNYGIPGIAPLNSVPYALYAANGTPGPKGDKGDTGATGPQGVAGLLTNGSAAGNTPYWNGSTWVTNTSNIFNNGGDIGIGTVVPTEKLDITGKVKASGTVTAGTVTYPNTHGSANQVLTTTGSGTLTWTTPSGGVPYTGATQSVNLGAYDLKVNGLTVGRGNGNEVSNSAIGNVALNSNTTGSGNTATGYRALSNTTTGSNNTATGSEALSANTTGSDNTSFGRSALLLNTTGSSNTVIGQGALAVNTTGGSNTVSGAKALSSNTTGSRNTAIGESSMLKNTTGSFNTATGYLSLSSNTTGEFNTAYGSYSMEKNTTGSENIAFGGEAFRNNTTGRFNVAVGTGTLGSNTTGDENTAIGRRAMNDNLTGTFNTAIGQAALYANKTGSNNTAMGRTSLVYNTEGESNTAIGATSITNNTTGSNNTGIGYNVLGANTTGGSNTAIGYNAGNTLTTGSNNTFLGNNTNAGANNLSNATAIGNGATVTANNTIQLGNTDVTKVITSGTVTAGAVTYPNAHGSANQVLTTTGSGTLTWTTPSSGGGSGVPYTGATQAVDLGAYDLKVNGLTVGRGNGNIGSNTATGTSALNRNTTGDSNTAIGASALSSNTTGNFNTASGNVALLSNTTGEQNTATGEAALFLNTIGFYNTATGFSALRNNTTGDANTASGNSALQSNTTGSNNTALGYRADVGSGALSNATALGYRAVVAASNTIQLGNASVTNVKTSGTVTAGAVTYPRTDGTNGQVLTTDGTGTASWGTPATGLPSSGNTPGDMLYWSGSAWVKVAAGSNGQILSIVGNTPTWQKPAIPSMGPTDVYNHETGKVWMDRNLGATQVANSSTDYLAYGSLYQWGRGSDGHELITWTNSTTGTPVNGTTSTLSDQPANGNFILQNNNGDWRSIQNDNLWQGISGVNNPCPTGYRIPTETEWNAERLSWSSNTSGGAFASPLKLPLAGNRYRADGSLAGTGIGTLGFYWSSTVNTANSKAIEFYSNDAFMLNGARANGYSVRCIKD